jgi:hypothetical protein
VHAGVRFTIVSQDAQQCRYRQEVTLLGMRQADDLLNTWLPDGSLHSEAVAGTNQGLRVLYRFAGNANLAMVWVTFEIPARGVKRWIAPLFRWVAQRALRKAFEEDRRDLESGAYARSAPRRPTPASQARVRRIRQRSRRARPKSVVRSFEPF